MAEREASLRSRERITGEHAVAITEREEFVRLREETLRAQGEADQARLEREQLVVQLRAANEQLVLASLHADELAEAAERTAAAEAEGRRRAESLASELVKSEQALRASEHQLQTLANTLPMLTFYANPDGSVAWYSQRWYEYTGCAPSELDDAYWQAMLDPEDLPRITAAWTRALATGEPLDETLRLRRHDGAMRWFLSRAVPLRGADGAIVRWFGVNVDIDERKRAEALSDANLRAKDEFLAILVHELRAPLAPIVAALDLMTELDPGVFSRERAIIERQVGNLVRLVGDLLDVSRITEGKVELIRKPIELAEIVTRAIEMASPLILKKGHQLRINVPHHGLAIDGDASRLVQVVGNLLTNAAKYTAPSGTIAVTGESHRGVVRLRVRDTGIGISPAMLPHVFELFAQERQPGSRSEGGMGLGLAIVSRLVAMHGGTVTASSKGVGLGSEFVIDLPRVAPIAVEAREARRRRRSTQPPRA